MLGQAFGFLFGWRKASKCKKLVRAVQIRLRLLKNKRNFIVSQLEEDVAQLLSYGLHQIAYQRVEELIKDKTAVEAYDLLDQFCEFIILSLPYISRHKDCPSDINEAASTLIFSSAWFGELPELRRLRKLFRERYGQMFVAAALELLPGNLVNVQMKEIVCSKGVVSEEAKCRMLDEISVSSVRTGQLLIEYNLDSSQVQGRDQTSSSDEAHKYYNHMDGDAAQPEVQPYNGTRVERKLICMDMPSEAKDVMNSSSRTSLQLPEETRYLNYIEEFDASPVSKDGHLQDQRLFLFKPMVMPFNNEIQHRINNGIKKLNASQENRRQRKSIKTRKPNRRRLRCTFRSSKQKVKQQTDRTDKNSVYRQEAWPIAVRMTNLPAEIAKEDQTVEDNSRTSLILANNNRSSPCRHIHPKLPDYDELVAKFTALKQTNLQNNQKFHEQLFL